MAISLINCNQYTTDHQYRYIYTALHHTVTTSIPLSLSPSIIADIVAIVNLLNIAPPKKTLYHFCGVLEYTYIYIFQTIKLMHIWSYMRLCSVHLSLYLFNLSRSYLGSIPVPVDELIMDIRSAGKFPVAWFELPGGCLHIPQTSLVHMG